MTVEPKGGRPRDHTVDSRTIAATLELLLKQGLGGVSIESVASQSGVSKASIYRRWKSKEDLLVDAVGALVVDADINESGDIRADLVSALGNMRTFVCDTRAGEVFPWLVGEMAARTEIGERYMNTVIAPKRTFLGSTIEKAIERGDLRPDLDPDVAIDMLMGPLFLRRMAGHLESTPDSWPATIVDTLLAGWKPAQTAEEGHR
jgi:AcrR family transcriptional regulator